MTSAAFVMDEQGAEGTSPKLGATSGYKLVPYSSDYLHIYNRLEFLLKFLTRILFLNVGKRGKD